MQRRKQKDVADPFLAGRSPGKRGTSGQATRRGQEGQSARRREGETELATCENALAKELRAWKATSRCPLRPAPGGGSRGEEENPWKALEKESLVSGLLQREMHKETPVYRVWTEARWGR